MATTNSNLPPTQTAVAITTDGAEARLTSPWVHYFGLLMAQVSDLYSQISGGGGGGGGLPDGYEVLTIPAGAGAYSLTLTPDFTTYEGMTYDIGLTRSVNLVAITPIGTGFEGKRVTLLVDGRFFVGTDFTIDTAVLPTGTNNVVDYPLGSYFAVEGRLRQDGTWFITSAYGIV